MIHTYTIFTHCIYDYWHLHAQHWNIHPYTGEGSFFSLGKGRWSCWIFVVPNLFSSCLFCVLIKFPMGSCHGCQVPNLFLHMFPNSCPLTMSFALSSILVNYIGSQKQEITTYLRVFWYHPNPDELFWQWVDQSYPSQKEINWTLGDPTTN